ncbi:MAG: MoaD/ThiS family protein [Desulfonatronovibrio sp. MSAO_Bac4]|nr:MAG: MoaD/ThiS family protein [Desulfonatronovibrio sp. MSAO_Bac4]
MPKICFKAFSFLQSKLSSKGVQTFNDCMEVDEGETVRGLMKKIGLAEDDVEAVFINGRVSSLTAEFKNGDRVALVPPGTPGPYRVLLGIRDGKKD